MRGSYAHGGRFDSSVQGAHGIAVLGSKVEIGHMSVSDVGGDCVYFAQGQSGRTRSSGEVHDSRCSRTGRNGITVVAGHDILVQGVTLGAIGYDVFDVEPNAGGNDRADRVTFTRNTVGSYALEVYSIVEAGAISNQSFVHNRVVGHGLKVAISNPTGGDFRPLNVTIAGNVSDTPQSPSAINVDNVDGLTITGNTIPMTGARWHRSPDRARRGSPAIVFPAAARNSGSSRGCAR